MNAVEDCTGPGVSAASLLGSPAARRKQDAAVNLLDSWSRYVPDQVRREGHLAVGYSCVVVETDLAAHMALAETVHRMAAVGHQGIRQEEVRQGTGQVARIHPSSGLHWHMAEEVRE